MKSAIFVLIIAGILSGCTAKKDATPNQEIVIQKVDKDDIRNVIKQEKMSPGAYDENSDALFSATGEGVPPMDTVSPAQALALAKRAAMADAYRQLAAKLYGVKINAKDTVKDAMLKDSTIEARVYGLIKNAYIINNDFKDGIYRVEMELKINKDKWQELFAY